VFLLIIITFVIREKIIVFFREKTIINFKLFLTLKIFII